MARVAGDRLNDVRESISLYNQVLAVDGARRRTRWPGLATLYDRERRWPALVEILERQRLNANAQNDAAAELALLERRGTLLYERLGATQAAIEVFRRIQELQPKNARATRALREIYAQSGDYAALESLYAEHGAFGDLCDQLTSLADRTADMAARTRLLERVALIAQEKLNQPERALKAYERILATDPRNRSAALALLPLYRDGAEVAAPARDLRGAAGHRRRPGDGVTRWPNGWSCSPRRARSASSGWGRRRWRSSGARARSRRRPRTRRCAPIWSGWRARPTSGARWRRCTRRARRRRRTRRSGCGCCAGRCASPQTRLFRPQDARKAAEQILAELGFDEEADAALEQILTQTKAWADLAKLLHARADRAPDAAERVRLLLRIAQLEEERVADLAAASADLDEDPRGGAGQRTRAARAGPAVRGAPGLGRRRRGRCAAIWRRRPADDARRSARRCCCASRTFRSCASTTRRRRSPPTARCCRRTRTRRRRWRGWSGCWPAATRTGRRSRA